VVYRAASPRAISSMLDEVQGTCQYVWDLYAVDEFWA
jgi:hypothetical protein